MPESQNAGQEPKTWRELVEDYDKLTSELLYRTVPMAWVAGFLAGLLVAFLVGVIFGA